MTGSNTKTVDSPLTTTISTDVGGVDAPASADTHDTHDTHDTAEVTDRIEEDRGEAAGEQVADKHERRSGGSSRRLSISISARSLAFAALIAILLGSGATFTWLYFHARQELDSQAHRSANNAHAEQVALEYAAKAATMNFQNLNEWQTNLVAGTSPELNDRLTEAAESMQQIVVPLKWTSTAEPLAAKVHSDDGGVYVVDCFVSVQTKTVQSPDALQSTATYRLTIDSHKDWEVTDVGGIGALVGQK